MILILFFNLWGYNSPPLCGVKLGVRGIWSPAYARISRRNLQYPAALPRGFFIFVGLIFSTIYSRKIYITLINYGVFIISTILTYKLISYAIKLLENNKIISECSSIVDILILMVMENIFSYLIVKKIIKIYNRIRGNCT
jgi:hypothetical protein